MFRFLFVTCLAGAAALGCASTSSSGESGTPRERLTAGNERFATGHAHHPQQSPARRDEVAQGQHPFAIVVACSDSRVAPELVFDQGLGDLFVVRVAGNVVDDTTLGSIEYAVEHLGAEFIVVLGHSKCGAVKAALDGGEFPGHIPALVKAIEPAVRAARAHPGPDLLQTAVDINVQDIVKQLATSDPILEEQVHAGHLQVVGACYFLDSGKVRFD